MSEPARPTPDPTASDGTRQALLDAALHLFGSKGFSATSTRELAALAKTNVASIAYHFGGKEGLRLACGEEFARRLAAVIATSPGETPSTPAAARNALRTILTRMTGFLLGQPQASDAAAFMLRELAEGSPTVDLVYDRFAEPAHIRLCALWAAATGAVAESEAVRLAVFSLIGQVLYFRIGARIVTRRMGWAALDQGAADQILRTVLSNLDAMIGFTGKA